MFANYFLEIYKVTIQVDSRMISKESLICFISFLYLLLLSIFESRISFFTDVGRHIDNWCFEFFPPCFTKSIYVGWNFLLATFISPIFNNSLKLIKNEIIRASMRNSIQHEQIDRIFVFGQIKKVGNRRAFFLIA